MNARHVAVPFLALATLSCAPPETVGVTSRAQIAQAVEGRLNVWTRAVNNRSLDTIETLYLHARELPIIWPDGEQTFGWSSASGKWKRWSEALGQLNFVVHAPVVDVIDAQVAVTTFRTMTDQLADGKRTREGGRGVLVWMQDPADRRWKIRAEHRSVVPATAP